MADIRNYDVTFRPNFEIKAAVVWFAAGGVSTFTPLILNIPSEPYITFTAFAVAMGIRRLPSGLKLIKTKSRINGADISFVNLEELKPILDKYFTQERLWLGYGWEWENKHTQLLYETTKMSQDEFMDKNKRDPSKKGAAWLHGLNPDDIEISQPLAHTEGHTLIAGTTGSGKSQPLYSKVLTTKGFKRMGDIKLTDILVCPDGSTSPVKQIYPQGLMPVYEFEFSDGRCTQSSIDHLWGTVNLGTLTTKEILSIVAPHLIPSEDDSVYITPVPESAQVFIPLPRPVTGQSHLLNFDPFSFAITLADREHDDITYPFSTISSASIAHSSIPQRVIFINGILQRSDKSIDHLDSYVFRAFSHTIARLIQQIVWSLGGCCTLITVNDVYELLIHHSSIHDHVMNISSSTDVTFDNSSSLAPKIEIISARYIGMELTQCLYIDHPDHLYITDNFIVTHNTRLFDHLITQAIMRNETVFIIDPKGDRELRENARLACLQTPGGEERFHLFHPAYPEQSVRLDLLKNFNRPTELASRISVFLSDKKSDPFMSFSNMALNNIIQGMLFAGDRPNLVSISSYLQNGTEYLVVSALQGYFNAVLHNWEHIITPYMAKANTPAKKADAAIRFYKDHCKGSLRSPDLEGLLSMYHHDRSHFSKMIASLLPVMNQLTSGSLGPLLSPDPSDVNDHRIITDPARIIRNNHVLHVGLDSLSDSFVAQSVGSILLSDLTSVAGDIYNYDPSPRRVNLFIDEVSEIINLPLIQTLNKGRGAGYNATLATQTFADFAAALGDANKARQVLGNINNTISLRITDTETQEYFCNSLPEVRVKYVMQTQGTTSSSDTAEAHSGNIGERLMEEEVPMIPPSLMGRLPDLEYFAKLADGRLIKGYVPILIKQ